MKIPTLEALEKFLISKSYQNDVTHKNVKKLSEKFISFLNDRNQSSSIIAESSISDMIEKFYIGSSQKQTTIKKDMGILKDFCRYTQELDNQDNLCQNSQTDQISLSDQKVSFQNGKSSSDIALDLANAEELAKIQQANLEQQNAKKLKLAQQLEAQKIAEAKAKAEAEAKAKAEARQARIEARRSGFVSQAIPEGVVRFEYAENIPKKSKEYFEQDNEKTLFYQACNTPKHTILKGSAGSGKTELAIKYAHENKIPCFKFSCSSDVRMSDLIGSKTFDESGQIKFEAGMLTKAVLAGNELGKSMIILDEINTLGEKIQKNVNGIADGTGFIDLPSMKLKINQGVQFLIIGTMNQSYAGTNPLNPEFKDRFSMIKMPKMSAEIKKKIFAKFQASATLENQLIKIGDKLDKMQEDNIVSADVVFSTRSQIAFLELLEEMEADKIPNAVKSCLDMTLTAKFDDPEHEDLVDKMIREVLRN